MEPETRILLDTYAAYRSSRDTVEYVQLVSYLTSLDREKMAFMLLDLAHILAFLSDNSDFKEYVDGFN